MRWLWVILTSSFLFPCGVLTQISEKSPDSISTTATLRELIITDCAESCWLGIEIGSTSREQVIDILEENGLAYSNQPIAIVVELMPNVLWEDAKNPGATIWLEDDIVVGILFPL